MAKEESSLSKGFGTVVGGCIGCLFVVLLIVGGCLGGVGGCLDKLAHRGRRAGDTPSAGSIRPTTPAPQSAATTPPDRREPAPSIQQPAVSTIQQPVAPPIARGVLDPRLLLIGREATVVLRDGVAHTGVLQSADSGRVSLTIGAEGRSYTAAQIAQVVQREPANLNEADRQAALAKIAITFRGIRVPRQGQRLVEITVTNKSRYDFMGRLSLTSFASDGEETAKVELDLSEGPPVGAGQAARYQVVFQTSRWVANMTDSAEGEFYRRIADVKPHGLGTR